MAAEAKSSTAGLKSFLSGGFGGVASVLVGELLLCVLGYRIRGLTLLSRESNRRSAPTGQPFDLTKTRLQTAAPGQYKGGLDVVKQTLARDGIKG